MNRIRFWPYGALAILGCAVVAAVAMGLWMKYEPRAKAGAIPNAARIERIDGQVGINQTADNATASQWAEATVNSPVTVGDRVLTKENSKTEIAFSGRNFATIDQNSSLDVLDLSEHRTQLALRSGSGLFDVGSIASGDLFEVATPCGAVDFEQAGLYQIALNDNGNATVTALSGEAQVIGQSGSSRIQKGESLALSCQGSAAMTRVEPNQAGATVDNYYRYRYPRKYDGRYRSYYTYLDDPYYYDPSRLYSSYNYVSEYIPGIDDLDDYGDWQYVGNYGYCWHPHTYTSWAPYQSGYWTMDYPYGLTWVSNEPWGYAPYHYGRWTNVSNEWYWVPESTRVYPTYSPALVAFIPLGQSSAAWVALGPGDPYVATYYDPYWQPQYVYGSNVVVERVMNINVPGAVTVVPVQDFTHVIDPTIIMRVDPGAIAQVRPVLDPLKIDPVKAEAFKLREKRPRIEVPAQLAQRLANTPVLTSTATAAPAFKRDLPRSLKVQPLPDRAKNQKLQVSDRRAEAATQAASAPNMAAEQTREKQMADLTRQAARGDRNARQQLLELRRQQTAPQRLEGAKAQGERVSEQVQQQQAQRATLKQQQKAQKESERQQMINSQQQRRVLQQQVESQRRQNEVQRVPQKNIRRSEQPQVLRPQSQPKPQPQSKPQPQYQRPAQPKIIAPPVRTQTAPRPMTPNVRVRPPAQAQPRPQPQTQRPQPQPKVQAQPKPPEQKGDKKKPPVK